MNYLIELLTTASEQLFNITAQPVLSRPDEQHGDYASNLAMQLAGQLKQPPLEIAQQLKDWLIANSDDSVTSVEVAKPGFLNLKLSDAALWQASKQQPAQTLKGQKILLEYSCPNPFKEIHTGHLYQTIAGDSLGTILASSGASVFRANFGGDVGLHVGKSLWGIKQALKGENPAGLSRVAQNDRAGWLSRAYVAGSKAFVEDQAAAEEIKKLNVAVYDIHKTDDHESPLAQIYWQCRAWSYDYFKAFYKQLDATAFDKYYPESAVTQRGLDTVQANHGTVFVDSQSAVIFKGEDVGQHTRVFITAAGLPTYETKDLGLILTEAEDFPYTRRIIMTGNDQSEYMRVVFAALQQIDEALAAKQSHLSNGTVRFANGQKMSSRLGNVLPATEVIKSVTDAAEAPTAELRQDITLGAIKYAFLKQRLGGDIAFDIQESVSLQGNSGPYLQYAYARACSILAKVAAPQESEQELQPGERTLVRKLGEYSQVVEQATAELAPHLICTYLYELAQVFNRFYENNRVLDDPRQQLRLRLVALYAAQLKSGLALLHVPTPEKI